MKSYIFCLLVLYFSFSIGESANTLSNTGSCSILESAIAGFLNDRSQPDTLYSIFEVEIYTTDRVLTSLMKSSKYKFAQSQRDLHSFSCKLAQVRSRNDVAKVLGVSKGTVDHWYNLFIGPIIDVGGVNHLRDISQIVGLLMAWSARTGYPIIPVKNVDERVTIKTFEAIKKAMMKKYIHDTLINAPFPLKVSPTRALKYLKSAKTYSEFERGVFLDPHQLEDFAAYVKANPMAISKGSKNVRSTMKFVDALERTGILYLK